MDENDYQALQEEQQRQIESQQRAQTARNINAVVDSFSSAINSREDLKKDKEAINKRANNSADSSNRFGGLKDRDEDGTPSKSRKKSDLDDKDGLGEKDGLDSKKDSKVTSNKNKNDKKSSAADAVSDKKEGLIAGKFNKLKLKIKIYLIALAVVLSLGILFVVVAYFIYGMDMIFGSISSFFGISVNDSSEGMSEKEADGLLTNEEYMINPSTGESYSTEELVEYLKNNNTCKETTWRKIKDWFDSWDGEYSDYCAYLRYISNHTEELESDYNTILDKGLTVSSLFYGFANQENYYDYKDNTNLENVDEITNAYRHYDSLNSVIGSKGVLNIEDVKTIIDNSLLVETGKRKEDKENHYYYVWDIEIDDNDTDDPDDDVAVGLCVPEPFPLNAHYSSLKWGILMRFGEEAAKRYENELRYNHQYAGTDSECKEYYNREDELLEIVKASSPTGKGRLDGGVKKTNKYFDEEGLPADLSPFSQKAVIDNATADSFSPFEEMELSYRNGFAYKKFPAFEKSFNDSSIDLDYDYIITPKQIEETIQEILTKKADTNYYLGFDDLDSNDYTMLGDYVIGANCEGYLTAAPDAIQVKVTDCDGNYLTTTSFKDYIMGVAYGEVSDSGDNYVLSEMVAAISYSLHRRGNYLKGNTITMRSGNCDQVYCPMGSGCSSKPARLSCGSFNCTSYIPGGGTYHRAASSSLQEKYANYYETAKNYLVVSNNAPHSAHYVSSIQLGWKEKANRGIPFTQIIQEEYQDEGAQLIQCNGPSTEDGSSSSPSTSTEVGSSVGSQATSGYPSVAPSMGRFTGFSYNEAPEGRNITINPAWINANIVRINTNCSAGGWNESYSINKAAVSNFTNAYKNMCKLLTTGVRLSDGTLCKYSKSDFINGGTFVQRKTSSGNYSLHAYGIAQDWNYSLRITYRGATYKPYYTQGSDAKAEYNRFVAALGKEEKCENVNYILWKYAFEPAGFNWGGNWSTSYWDGMHFEVKY